MLFDPWQMGDLSVPNRLVRAATYEGLAAADGTPLPALGELYARLAAGGVGLIITGFCYVSHSGRAMQPRQCGIDSDGKLPAWRRVVDAARAAESSVRLFMQIAHAGRQTLPQATGGRVLAPSAKASPYFRARPASMRPDEIHGAIDDFAAAARRARQAGFAGVELHGAHGYLIHQFLSPHTNRRRDTWGADRLAFLREILRGIAAACGRGFPVMIKLSAGDFHPGGVTPELAASYAARLEQCQVDALEVSCGTMDLAMNIFRGGLPVERALTVNPLFAHRKRWQRALWKRFLLPRMRRRLLPFSEAYNRAAARLMRTRTRLPLVLVGGLRGRAVMEEVLSAGDATALALCRPLICEIDLPHRLRADRSAGSSCTNCNLCAVMCDGPDRLRCYRKEDSHGYRHQNRT